MPYQIVKEGEKWCVKKKDSEKSFGCHDSESKAKNQMAALYANEKSAYAQFSMRIANAFVPESGRRDRKMRLNMVTSDIEEDVYEEKMSLDLYKDFVRRINENIPVPEPFNDVICEDGWCGGMPYPSISHYKSGAGKNIPGEIERVHIDGELLKADAFLDETPLGLAVWKSVCDDLEEKKKPLEERTHANPVRVSIGFLDLQHKHVEDDGSYIFTRSNLKQTCPKCEEGIKGKVYLQGQLVHLAFTRVPANPRTSVEVFRMDEEILTKKDDAQSIVGELAEELVGKSITTADEVLIIKAEEVPAVEKQEAVMEVKAEYKEKEDCPDGDEDCKKKMEKKSEVVAPVKSAVELATEKMLAKLNELKQKNVTGDSAVKEIQPFFNAVGEVVKSELTNPIEQAAEINRAVIREELQALVPEIVSQIMKAIPTSAPAQLVVNEVPKPRSLVMPERSAHVAPARQLTEIEKIAYRNTIPGWQG